MKKKSIRVPLESWVYLQDQCKLQRCGDHISDKTKEHLKREMEKPYNQGGHQLTDGDLGGAIGNPLNSYEEGRWTSWSINEMKEMLKDQNLPYTDAEDVEEINIFI